MSVAVVFPYRAGCSWREESFEWVRAKYREQRPDWELVTGSCRDDEPFNRSAAIIDGALRTQADTIVVSDSDVWCEDLEPGLVNAAKFGWSTPYVWIHRLPEDGSRRFMLGEPLAGLPFAGTDKLDQDSSPYIGNECGTLTIFQREVLLAVPPDVRFVGWGQEDEAWGHALRCLHGMGRRSNFTVAHLWHPPQERMNRRIGNEESAALAARYHHAAKRPDEMRELLLEAQFHWRAKVPALQTA